MTNLPKWILEARRVRENSTKGPWVNGFTDGSGKEYVNASDKVSIAKTNWGCGCCEGAATEQNEKDAAFISAAPETQRRLETALEIALFALGRVKQNTELSPGLTDGTIVCVREALKQIEEIGK